MSSTPIPTQLVRNLWNNFISGNAGESSVGRNVVNNFCGDNNTSCQIDLTQKCLNSTIPQHFQEESSHLTDHENATEQAVLNKSRSEGPWHLKLEKCSSGSMAACRSTAGMLPTALFQSSINVGDQSSFFYPCMGMVTSKWSENSFKDNSCKVCRKVHTSWTSPLEPCFPPISSYIINEEVASVFSLPRKSFAPYFRILQACSQCTSIPIHRIFNNLDQVFKVNEGVFGEVYGGIFCGTMRNVVYKLIPIEGIEEVNGERQKTFEEIETEIRVSQRLNFLSASDALNFTDGFCYLYHVRLVRGLYPKNLLEAWKKWDKAYKSDNDVPNFPISQLYIIFEYENVGRSVENCRFIDARQPYSILLQVAFALGVAELAIQFEHRDLHWGNILVREANTPIIHYRFLSNIYQIPSFGIKATIIDFTVSRFTDEFGNPAFYDFKNDEKQFTGINEYQFEIYRMMRRENRNNWEKFHPKTNIFWLHYLVDKFLKTSKYTDVESQRHKYYWNHLIAFEQQILAFDSCAQFVQNQRQYLVTPNLHL